MKRSRRLLFAALAAALVAGQGLAEEERHEDHEALRRLRDLFQDAAARNDLDLLKPHLAPDFSIVTFMDREFLDFDSFKAQWQKTRAALLGEEGSYRVQLNPEYSTLIDDIALCRGNSSNVLVNSEGQTFTFGAHWSVVCRKIDGQWKIVRGHNSLDPFRNPMLEHGVRKLVVRSSLAAFAGGAVAGAALLAVVRRRRPAGA